jgi:hypothetical protein
MRDVPGTSSLAKLALALRRTTQVSEYLATQLLVPAPSVPNGSIAIQVGFGAVIYTSGGG